MAKSPVETAAAAPAPIEGGIAAQALATVTPHNGELAITLGGRTVKVIGSVALPQLHHVFGVNNIIYVTFTKPFTESTPRRDASDGVMKSVKVAEVVDLSDDVVKTYVGGAKIVSTLEERFRDQSYVGHSFAIKKAAGPAGKRYYGAEVIEIQLD